MKRSRDSRNTYFTIATAEIRFFGLIIWPVHIHLHQRLRLHAAWAALREVSSRHWEVILPNFCAPCIALSPICLFCSAMSCACLLMNSLSIWSRSCGLLAWTILSANSKLLVIVDSVSDNNRPRMSDACCSTPSKASRAVVREPSHIVLL